MGMNEKIALCNETSFPNPVPAQVTTNDLALVEATRQGNAEAFAVLVERHTSMIYSLALRLLGGESEAEDATQEAFILSGAGRIVRIVAGLIIVGIGVYLLKSVSTVGGVIVALVGLVPLLGALSSIGIVYSDREK
jgi:hypothetical protein